MKQRLAASIIQAFLGCATLATSLQASPQSVTYDFVKYGGPDQPWIVEAGAMLQVEVYEDLSTPENDVYFKFRNNIFTALGYESSIMELEIDTGTLNPGMFQSLSIWDHSPGVNHRMYTPCSDPVTLLCGAGTISWSGDYASGGLANSGPKIDGVNPGEYLTLKAVLSDGLTYSDVIQALNIGMSTAYVEGPYSEWTQAEKENYRAGAVQGLRFALLVHSIVPNTWNTDSHGLFVTHKVIGISASAAPQINGITATPVNILDTQTSQLSVNASDPDADPLSYQWTIVSGGGSLNDPTSASPVYTPDDVVGAQTVTLRVDVSDGSSTVSGTLNLPVWDAAPPPGGPLLVADDFSTADLAGWSVHDEGSISAPSKWQVKSGELAQLSNIQGSINTASDLSKLGTYLLHDAGVNWTDYRVRFKLRSMDDDTLGFMFRVQDGSNYYRFSWDKQRSYRRLVKNVGGQFTELASDNVPYVQGQTYLVEILAVGSQLEVWIDGVRIFQVSDASHAQGSIAFYTWMNNGAYFDDLTVEYLGSDPLNALPQISGLTATPAALLDTQTSQLAVTATDPDGGPSPLSYQWTIVSGGGVLDDATSATPVYTPSDVVGTQTVTLRVAVSDGTATVTGNLSLQVSDANPPPPGPQLLAADFTGADLTGWSVHDDGTVSAPSKWQVKSGELAQLSNIQGSINTASDLSKLGTYLLHDAGVNWTDYRVRFKLRSMDDDTLGFMFRVQDGSNYYRFSWDKQRSYRRLVKNVGGQFTELASDNVPYVQGQTYLVEILAVGSQLEVWIDGVRIFQVSDASHAQGSIAFYTWMNNGAYFDELQVNAIE